MNKAALALLIAPLLAVAACGGGGGTPPLAGAAIGGPFALTDQDGRAVTQASYAGKYRLMYFGYTFCPDVCPTDVAQIMRGYAALGRRDAGKAARLQPIFVSVDPARDTPAVMRQFVGAFGAGLVGLTGSEAEIARVAKEYGVYYRKAAPAPGAAADAYLVDHSRTAILFGPDGRPIAIIAQDGTPDAIAAELDRWIA